jgi:hypothetical protein
MPALDNPLLELFPTTFSSSPPPWILILFSVVVFIQRNKEVRKKR